MLHAPPSITKLNYEDYDIAMLRLDLIHPEVSGNKWYKLKYNLEKARQLQKDTILTFGGAFSNHIAATAYACKSEGFKSIGIIRGEETALTNSTLSAAKQRGMDCLFVSREEYRLKDTDDYLQKLAARFPGAYIIPEGGDNALGQKGCEDILTSATNDFTYVFCAYGTGTTFKGLAKSLKPWQQLVGVNVLKYEALNDAPQAKILNGYHFGGYAKHIPELLKFKSWFENTFHIELDYVYTAKLCYAVFDLIRQGKLNKEDKILIIHTGGLQGNAGYEARYNLNPMRQVNDPQG